MTENLLTWHIAALMRCSLNSFLMDAPDGELSGRSVSVREGFLPALRTRDSAQDFPFCLVRPVSGTINPEQTNCAVDLIFGCYVKDDMGYQFAVNLMRHSANALLTLENLRLAKRYMLQPHMTWDLDQEQPYPAWYSVLHTSWSFVTPKLIPTEF